MPTRHGLSSSSAGDSPSGGGTRDRSTSQVALNRLVSAGGKIKGGVKTVLALKSAMRSRTSSKAGGSAPHPPETVLTQHPQDLEMPLVQVVRLQ